MSKPLNKINFGSRVFIATSLVTAVMAFGCTTDRTLGNGKLNDRSGVRMAPTAGSSTGSETPAVYPPPMTSSSSSPTDVSASSPMKKLTADEAAQIMADGRPTYRVLGPVNPGTENGYARTQQLVSPVVTAAPVYPATGIGTDADAVVVDPNDLPPDVDLPPDQAPATVSSSTLAQAPATVSSSTLVGTTLSPTNAAVGVTPGAFAAGPGSTPFAVTNSGRTIGTTMPAQSSSFAANGSATVFGGTTFGAMLSPAARTPLISPTVTTPLTPTNAAFGVSPRAFAAGPGSTQFAATNSARVAGTNFARVAGTTLPVRAGTTTMPVRATRVRVVNGANGVTVTNQ